MLKLVATLVAAASLTGSFAAPGTPAFPSTGAASITQQQGTEILAELRATRGLLERLTNSQATPSRSVTLTNRSGFELGSADAPLTMVEFVDLQCPFCREYATTVFEDIKKNWIDTGKLRYPTRDLPLDMHPHARNAARGARCSGEQGKFWDMHTRLLRNANLLSPEYIAKTADELGLDATSFSSCLASKRSDEAIERDIADAVKAGIRGTPTFVLGRSGGATLTGVLIVGAQPYSVFATKLNEPLTAGDPSSR